MGGYLGKGLGEILPVNGDTFLRRYLFLRRLGGGDNPFEIIKKELNMISRGWGDISSFLQK